jgi:hypothetical protein
MAADTTLRSQTWLVAIEIAKAAFDAVPVEGSNGERKNSDGQSSRGHDRLVGFLRGLLGRTRIALEQTGDVHRTLAHRLLREGSPWSRSHRSAGLAIPEILTYVGP